MKNALLALVLNTLVIATPAIAADTALQTSESQPVATGPYLSWTGACKTGFLEIVIDQAPLNGELTIEMQDGKIDTVVTGEFGSCKGKTVQGKNVTYHPNPGFKGKDRFVLKVTYQTKETLADAYIVTVK